MITNAAKLAKLRVSPEGLFIYICIHQLAGSLLRRIRATWDSNVHRAETILCP